MVRGPQLIYMQLVERLAVVVVVVVEQAIEKEEDGADGIWHRR